MNNIVKMNDAQAKTTADAGLNMTPKKVESLTLPAQYYWKMDDGNIYVEIRTDAPNGKKFIIPKMYKEGEYINPGAGVHCYIAGVMTNTKKPPQDLEQRLGDLWTQAAESPVIYIVEGCKKAEILHNASGVPVLTLGSSSNSTAANWAPIASRLNRDAQIIVFSDNDKVGRKAAENALGAFHAAEFKNLSLVDFAKHEPTPTFPGIDDKYDIADWLKEGRDLAFLLDTANGFIRGFNLFYVESYRDAILKAAETRRECVEEWELVSGEGETTNEKAHSKDRFEEIVDKLPEPIAESVKECATGFNVNQIVVASLELTTFGGWYGRNRANMRVLGRNVDPLIHSCCVGDSGAGKSPLMNMLTDPIKIIQEDERALSSAARKRLFYLEEDLKERMKERRELYKSGDAAGLKRVEGEIDAIREKISAAKVDSQTYLMKAASPQGIIRLLDRNAKSARAQKRTPPGAIIYGTEGQRIYNARLGSRSTADEWGIWNDIADGGINNAETKDDSTTNKEYSYSGAFCTGIQGTSCNWIRDIELLGNGFSNRTNWVYLDYRYGINPNFADADKLEKRRRVIEASYEWQGATFQPNDELKSEFKNWLENNKLRADAYRRRGDKAGAAYLLKNEIQVLRIALNIHITRQFWELVKDDTREFKQWRRLGRRERMKNAGLDDLLKELETAEGYDAGQYDATANELFPGSFHYWDEFIQEDGVKIQNPRLIVPTSELELAAKIVRELEIERSRCLGIVAYESDKTRELKIGKFDAAIKLVLAKAEEKAEIRYDIPADLDAENLERFKELGVKGVHIIPRRILAQQCRPYKTKTLQELIDPELKERGLIIDLGARIAFIEYAE